MTTEQLEVENKRIHDEIEREAKSFAITCWVVGAIYIAVIGLLLFGVTK